MKNLPDKTDGELKELDAVYRYGFAHGMYSVLGNLETGGVSKQRLKQFADIMVEFYDSEIHWLKEFSRECMLNIVRNMI